ncbi:MAG TPA: iron-sulfur cluster assembly accessory protein [Fimbriimonas sp.]
MKTSTFPITITEAAENRVRQLLKKDGRENAFLRLGVKGGGCSGMEYVMKFDDRELPGDLVLELDGLIVRCDAKSAVFLEGATFDFTGNLMSGGFKFDNPNADRSCGCGTSFTPKDR